MVGEPLPGRVETPVDLMTKDRDRRKTDYFVSLMIEAKQYWRKFTEGRESKYVPELWQDEGLMEHKPITDGSTGAPERKHGAPEHMLTVMAGSKALGELLSDIAGLGTEDIRDLVIAAALHDVNKDIEFQAVNMTINDEKQGYGQGGYDLAGKISGQKLKFAGVPNNIIELHDKCGHASCPEIEAILRGESELSPKEQIKILILHYVDDIVTNPNVIDVSITEDENGQPLNALDRRCIQNERNEKYQKYNEAWQKDPRNKTGEMAFAMQRRVGHMVEEHLAQLLGLKDPLQLPAVLSKRIKEDILNYRSEALHE